MEKAYVIAYYGNVYSKQFGHHGWKDVYIGRGIVHESKRFEDHPMAMQVKTLIAKYAPEKYNYAIVEERYYPTGE